MREHRLVGLIDAQLEGDEYKDLVEHPRVRSLPDMLRRHGLLQVAAFLKSKGKAQSSGTDKPSDDDSQAARDRALLGLLAKAVEEDLRAVPETAGDKIQDLDVASLARLGQEHPEEYLYLNESAIYAATWIQRLAAAREVLQAPGGA
jgi:CRISPR type III-B/RAMP module-associated protein Cmr5